MDDDDLANLTLSIIAASVLIGVLLVACLPVLWVLL